MTLFAGTVHGLREWRVERGSLTLRSGGFDDPTQWRPHGQATVAVCATHDAGAGVHEPPGQDCACGLYAYHPDRASTRRAFVAATMGNVVGIVEAWGKLELHVGGFRAQFARPHAFVRAPGREPHAEIQNIAAHHDAHVLTVEGGEELYEHCLRHELGIAEQVLEESFGTAYWRARLRNLTYWSGPPTWPPNINAATRCSMDLTPGELLYEYKRQRAGLGRTVAAARAVLAENGITTAAGDFTFLRDRDGTLCRWDEGYASAVWRPANDREPGQWHGYPINPFTANVTAITPAEAQELAGPGADLYAEAPSSAPPVEASAG
jgi:hypothetical protein